MYFGVDVGGTRLRVIGQHTETERRTDVVEMAVPRTLDEMVAGIARLAGSIAGGAESDGIVVGLPGHVDGNRCVWIPNLRFLDGADLGGLISQQFNAPCELINDAQATLLAESREGAAAGQPNAVLIAVGTGIGGAYQIDGRLARGAHGCAGSFGWLTMGSGVRDEDHGEWEQLGAGRSLERRAEDWGSTELLIDAARRGDDRAQVVLNEYGTVLGHGAAALASIFDPDIIVFAGGISVLFDLLSPAMKAALYEHASPVGQTVGLVSAELGGCAGVIGALHLAVEDGARVKPGCSRGGSTL